MTNEIAAIQTIVGPAGVSKIYAASSPPNADRHPIIAAIIVQYLQQILQKNII